MRFEPEEPFTGAEIEAIERSLGRELPADYVAFVRVYGGAFAGGSVDGLGDFAIDRFFSADAENGVLSKLECYDDLRQDQILPIAGCVLGNVYVLDRSNAVWHIDYYGGATTASRVSESFADFLGRIVVADE